MCFLMNVYTFNLFLTVVVLCVLQFSITQVLPDTSRGQFHIGSSGSLLSSQLFDYHRGPKASGSMTHHLNMFSRETAVSSLILHNPL